MILTQLAMAIDSLWRAAPGRCRVKKERARLRKTPRPQIHRGESKGAPD